ncbi:MAG TPA: hypothetical protein VFO14_17075 [Vicinamibacterales bacterium]|nr:hypothetical protein [Vicinamibacterales bacterium]
MRHALLPRLPMLLAVLLVGGACDNGDIVTIPDSPTVTETYTGTVARNGSQIHSFISNAHGAVTATLTAVEPTGSPAIGFSMGTWDGTICSAVLTNNNATVTSQLTGTIVGISSLCIRLFDPFTRVPDDAPVNYTVTVVRPQ